LNILALDASANLCSVAVSVGSEVFSVNSDKPRSHSQLLLPMVLDQLESANITLQDINAIAFGAGPGSFTGLRIAFSIAQGLAFGLNIPMVPICSLMSIANSVPTGVVRQTIVSVLDARMNELYWAAHEQSPEGLREISPPVVQSIQTTEQKLKDLSNLSDIVVAGPGAPLLQGSSVLKPQSLVLGIEPSAPSVLELAKKSVQTGQGQSAGRAQLTYLRNEVSWNKRKRIRQDTESRG